jgi:hypothetical protein
LGIDTYSETRYDAGDRNGLIVGAKEGESMKKHWARGALLGLSMALLLAGGVALAQSASVDKDCFECIPLEYETHPEDIPYDPFLFTVAGSGWEVGEAVVNVDFLFGSGKTDGT